MAFEESGGGVSEGSGKDRQDDFFNMSGNEDSRGQADLPRVEPASSRPAPDRPDSGRTAPCGPATG